MNGILVLDKPLGITSHEAVSAVNRILRFKRAGHTGTLDPFATGVLPICVNGATKIIPFMKSGAKKYEALLRLGVKTDTLDLTGKVLEERDVGITEESALIDVFSKYEGKISQIPPMYSAVKKDGVRLYEYARQGVEIERPAREVTINKIELIEFSPPFVRFMVECSRGTYIRVLASDIAEDIGCGGHLAELRRIESDGFTIEDAVTIEDVKGGRIELTPPGDALSHMKRLDISGGLAEAIRQGKQIRKAGVRDTELPRFTAGERFKVYDGSELVSVTEAAVDSSDIAGLKDGAVIFKLLRVFN